MDGGEAAQEREARRELEDFFQYGAIALHLVAPDGVILRANQAELDLLGYSQEEYVGQRLDKFHADPEALDDILARLSRGERLANHEARLVAKDGSIRDVLISSNARFEGGRFVNTRCFTIDVTARKQAEAGAQWLKAIVEGSDDAIISKNLDGIVTSWNRSAERIFGYRADEIVGKPVTILIPDDRHDEEPEILRRLRAGERIDHYETVRRRKDGSFVDISLTVSPIQGPNGRIVGASKIARDITDRRRSEEKTDLLMAELDHRANNLLATVQAVAISTQAESVSGYLDSFLGRLRSIARAHKLLTESRWDGVALERLVEDELAAFASQSERRITVSGPPVVLSPMASEALSMTMHELATNSAKYGALSTPMGRVSVDWDDDVGGGIEVRWTESDGPPVREPSRRGFGTRLIERTAGHIQGASHVEWRPSGLIYRISIPSGQMASGSCSAVARGFGCGGK